MFEFLKRNKNKSDVLKVAEKQLRENRAALESLRDYDSGKKSISTSHVERRLGNVRVAPQK
jgi:hypothetical protein